jgi:hypothetical protein
LGVASHQLSAAVRRAIDASSISDKKAAYEGYIKAASGRSNSEARIVAQDIIGEPVFWDWDRMFRWPGTNFIDLILGFLDVKCLGHERVITTAQLASRFVSPPLLQMVFGDYICADGY